MAALATLANFEIRYGRIMVGGEITQVGALLIDASALVLDVADLDTDWTAATLPAVVLPVVCEVVRRGFDNPAGLQSESIGDYTWRLGGNANANTSVSSGLYLTNEEKRTIRRAAAKPGVGSLTLTNYLPLPAIDSQYAAYMNDEDVVVVNSPEPEEL